MPKNIPSLKTRELVRRLETGGYQYLREGKGDHKLYFRYYEGKKRMVPIDIGAGELSPAYVLRIFRQFGFSDEENETLLK